MRIEDHIQVSFFFTRRVKNAFAIDRIILLHFGTYDDGSFFNILLSAFDFEREGSPLSKIKT